MSQFFPSSMWPYSVSIQLDHLKRTNNLIEKGIIEEAKELEKNFKNTCKKIKDEEEKDRYMDHISDMYFDIDQMSQISRCSLFSMIFAFIEYELESIPPALLAQDFAPLEAIARSVIL